MKKVILIVEDLKEQQELAKSAVIESGYGVIVAENLQDAKRMIDSFGKKLSGIVTDLHFPEVLNDPHPEKPAGLTVIIYAIQAGLPVAVCSDINNHYAMYAREIISFLANQAVGGEIPFTMNSKNWKVAIENLNILIKKGELS